VAGVTIRSATPDDLERIAAIQDGSPEAAHWNARDYLDYDTLVAVCEDCVAGFLVARQVSADASEILNLAVDPAFRRRGIGRSLVREALRVHLGETFLEVREGHMIARQFYESMGFSVTGRRPEYYPESGETAIVMKIHSC
jgi:ribosomal-protein-alanine N-acetyltransferase